MSLQPRRRTVLAAGALLPVAAMLPASADRRTTASSTRGTVSAVGAWRFLSDHQAAVVTEATARLVPGPLDDPAEAGHPGAREAGVTHFIDRLLAHDEHPPPVFAGGPWSNRHANGPDHFASFVPLVERQQHAWPARLSQLRRDVTTAVAALDHAAQAGGYADFVAAPAMEKDRILTDQTDARNTLFALTIDAMYSAPEYGGNANLSGWHEIKFPGDVQPVGYSAAQVEASDGPDPVAVGDLPIVDEAIRALPWLARARAARGPRRG
jgi:hypothetical protein